RSQFEVRRRLDGAFVEEPLRLCQRRYPICELTGCPKRLPGRGENSDLGTCAQQRLCARGGGIQEVLAVVYHEQSSPLSQCRRDGREQVLARLLGNSQSGGQR